jgi:hypothetical protein
VQSHRRRIRAAGKQTSKRKGGSGKNGGRNTGRASGGIMSPPPTRHAGKPAHRVAVRPGSHKRTKGGKIQSFRPGRQLAGKPAGMPAEQWADYIAAADGKISWAIYFRKWTL